MTCYLCGVEDPNETRYHPREHAICMVCAVKLWELAQFGVEFDLRENTVQIRFAPPELDKLPVAIQFAVPPVAPPATD